MLISESLTKNILPVALSTDKIFPLHLTCNRIAFTVSTFTGNAISLELSFCFVGGLQGSGDFLPLWGHGELLLAAGGGPVSPHSVSRVLFL